MICEEKCTVHFQGSYFWGDAQVLGYGRLKKIVQIKDTLNKKKSIPCWCWSRGLVFFFRIFLRFVLLLLLLNSGKIVIPHDHLLLLLQILYLVLFKSLQRQYELSISGRVDLAFFCNGYVAIYFQLSVLKSCPPCAAIIQQVLHCYLW